MLAPNGARLTWSDTESLATIECLRLSLCRSLGWNKTQTLGLHRRLRTCSTFGKLVCNKEEEESISEPISIYVRNSKTSKESFFCGSIQSQHDSDENAITHTLVNYHKQFDAVYLNAQLILIFCQEDYLLYSLGDKFTRKIRLMMQWSWGERFPRL